MKNRDVKELERIIMEREELRERVESQKVALQKNEDYIGEFINILGAYNCPQCAVTKERLVAALKGHSYRL